MRHVLSKNGDIKFVHSLSPRGFEAQRADGARLHFLGRDGTRLLATRVADDPLDALWIELAYAVGVVSQSPGSRRSRASVGFGPLGIAYTDGVKQFAVSRARTHV